MLTLFHHPVSANSRRVLIMLLEKSLPFELVPLKLDGDQFQQEFLQLNPFHQIPVLVDDGFKIIESLAILDYLEAKFPALTMMPTAPQDLAIVRMVQMLTVNALRSALTPLTLQMLGVASYEPQQLETARDEVAIVFTFFEGLLGDRSYFGGEELTLADITAIPSILSCQHLNFSLERFPLLQAWQERLWQRPSVRSTEPSAAAIAALMRGER